MISTLQDTSQLNVKNRTLFTADNLDIMRGVNSETIDLIYLDPPFNSNRNYAAPIGSQAAGAAFSDTWSLDDIKKEWAETLETENKALWAAITAAGYISGESMQAYLTYMAIRLLEMKRLLKDTGSIYLHCDPTASHYLKTTMDAIFGKQNFRNEIVWQRTITRKGNVTRRLARDTDVILGYSQNNNYVWNGVIIPYDLSNLDEKTRQKYCNVDKDGRLYQLTAITAPVQNPESSLTYEVMSVTRTWRWTKARMQKEISNGRVIQTKPGNVPRQVRYLDEQKGKHLNNVWTDITTINSQAKERTGYPTQKPLALLERIIKASSNEGNLVLDPFCGCATTCIAAEKLKRQWIGIDIEQKARELVIERLENEVYNDSLLKGATMPAVTHRKNAPKRTDADAPKRSPNIKQVLYKKQDGRCAAPCQDGKVGRSLDIDIFEVDHINPRSKGGDDVDR